MQYATSLLVEKKTDIQISYKLTNTARETCFLDKSVFHVKHTNIVCVMLMLCKLK